MRVLFLDIDGVLNSTETPEGEIEERYAQHLDRIVYEARPLYVVLSSTWRLFADLKRVVDQRFVIFGVTPELPKGTRGEEVNEYLQRHPQFAWHAILDDDTDFRTHQPLFHTPNGLTAEIADDVIKHFARAGAGTNGLRPQKARRKPPRPPGSPGTTLKKGIG